MLFDVLNTIGSYLLSGFFVVFHCSPLHHFGWKWKSLLPFCDFFFNWSIVDLPRYVHFCWTVKWFSYTHISILPHIPFHCGLSQHTEYSSLGYPGGLPWGLRQVENPPAMRETWVWSLGRKIPWRRAWQPTPVLLPGESHRQRSLAGCSAWGHKVSGMTEHAHITTTTLYWKTTGTPHKGFPLPQRSQTASPGMSAGSLFTKPKLSLGWGELTKMLDREPRQEPCCTFCILKGVKAGFGRCKAPCPKPLCFGHKSFFGKQVTDYFSFDPRAHCFLLCHSPLP